MVGCGLGHVGGFRVEGSCCIDKLVWLNSLNTSNVDPMNMTCVNIHMGVKDEILEEESYDNLFLIFVPKFMVPKFAVCSKPPVQKIIMSSYPFLYCSKIKLSTSPILYP